MVARRALEFDPNYGFGWWWLGLAQTELGLMRESVESLEKAHAIFGDFTLGISGLGHGYARAGRRAEAEECLRRLRATPPERTDPYHLALIHAGMGETEQAIECVSQAVARSSVWFRIYGPQDPRLDSLREDGRFARLLVEGKHAGAAGSH